MAGSSPASWPPPRAQLVQTSKRNLKWAEKFSSYHFFDQIVSHPNLSPQLRGDWSPIRKMFWSQLILWLELKFSSQLARRRVDGQLLEISTLRIFYRPNFQLVEFWTDQKFSWSNSKLSEFSLQEDIIAQRLRSWFLPCCLGLVPSC